MKAITVLQNKKIVLGVTGSIACYKVVDLASKLTQAGALVDVVMTESAQQFVTPLAFRSVTGRPVFTDMWSLEEHVRHVGLGETADLLLIAPATAHTMAKLAQGLADNLLTVTALAARCPLFIAPAMDGGMYGHPATQANVALLEERGATILGPAEGRMASGLVGKGRMLEPAELLAHLNDVGGRNGVGRVDLLDLAKPHQEPRRRAVRRAHRRRRRRRERSAPRSCAATPPGRPRNRLLKPPPGSAFAWAACCSARGRSHPPSG